MSTSRLEKKQAFIRQLAVFLAGINSARYSMLLEMGNEAAIDWKELRQRTPLSGYPTVDEAEETLREFLC